MKPLSPLSRNACEARFCSRLPPQGEQAAPEQSSTAGQGDREGGPSSGTVSHGCAAPGPTRRAASSHAWSSLLGAGRRELSRAPAQAGGSALQASAVLLRAVVKLVSWDLEQPKYSGASLGYLLAVTNVGHPAVRLGGCSLRLWALGWPRSCHQQLSTKNPGPAARPPGAGSQPGSLLPGAAPGHQLPRPPGRPSLSLWWADPAVLGDRPGGTGSPTLTPSLEPITAVSEEQLSPVFHPIPAVSGGNASPRLTQKWKDPNPLTKTQPHMSIACEPQN